MSVSVETTVLESGVQLSAANAESLRTQPREAGFIDTHGGVPSLGGWFFTGWIVRPTAGVSDLKAPFTAEFEEGEIQGVARLTFFDREDVESRSGIGVLGFARPHVPAGWRLKRLMLSMDGLDYPANAGRRSAQLEGAALLAAVSQAVGRVRSEGGQTRFKRLLAGVYPGYDTLATLASSVRLEIDAAIVCPPDGVFLIGWRLFAEGAVAHVRLRCGPLCREIDFDKVLTIERPDVSAAGVGAELGVSSARCGFMTYVPGCFESGEPLYLEVETADGQIGFRTLKRATITGLPAIKRILHDLDVRYDELDEAFDATVGPAVTALNAHRLAAPVQPEEIVFGEPPSTPVCSVIVPLYGRIDFLEYQMALFSEASADLPLEFIYVLDDPPRRRELENLAQSVFARFQVPIRLLLLPENVGFAPANNHGLRAARGAYVCFLNSDAFPRSSDWVARLIGQLAERPEIGVIAPRLLFEDGTIQHEGCIFRPLQEFGGWMYVDHDGRGRWPGAEKGVREVPAITGACVMMRRALADELGGFDEAYIVGDFEDADLCMKVRARGLTCVVDRDLSLYHLERKSQAGSQERWRQNLTLYNAWVHQRRWFPAGVGP